MQKIHKGACILRAYLCNGTSRYLQTWPLFPALNLRSWITQVIVTCKSVYIVSSSVQINIC